MPSRYPRVSQGLNRKVLFGYKAMEGDFKVDDPKAYPNGTTPYIICEIPISLLISLRGSIGRDNE
jgi:hypothetical protein